MDREELRKISKLCMITLSEDDLKVFHRQIIRILEYFTRIDNLDVEDLETGVDILNDSRDKRFDLVEKGKPKNEIIFDNMPETENGYLKVPRIIPPDNNGPGKKENE